MNLFAPKSGAEHELLLNKPTSCLRFVNHLSRTQAALQSVTKFIENIIMILVPPKAAARHELLLDKPTSCLRFVKHLSRTQAAVQSVSKFIIAVVLFWSHFVV